LKYDPRIKLSDSEAAFVRRFCWERRHNVEDPDSSFRRYQRNHSDLANLATVTGIERENIQAAGGCEPAPPVVRFPWESPAELHSRAQLLSEASEFQLSTAERNFLSHWIYETGLHIGPVMIWSFNNRVPFWYAPYAMSSLLNRELIEAGHEGWFWERPPVPFTVPWTSIDEFWHRATVTTAMFPNLSCSQGDDHMFKQNSLIGPIKSALTPDEKEFLRTYNLEMMSAGSGYHITLATQHGALDHHLIPFFCAMDDLYRPPLSMPVRYPWRDFAARYQELCGRTHRLSDYELSSGFAHFSGIVRVYVDA
jgi:hypothetical protein